MEKASRYNALSNRKGIIPTGIVHNIDENGSPVKGKFKKQTETLQFERWFRDSKAKDENILSTNRVRRDDSLWMKAKNLRDSLTGGEMSAEYVYKSLASILGSAKAASEFLYSVGIHGITYIGESSDERNYIAFSGKDIRVDQHIMFQPLRKPGAPNHAGEKGQLRTGHVPYAPGLKMQG